MLILSRKENQQIYIDGKEIIITVVRIRGDRVSIGIDAPKHISVDRKEIRDRIRAGIPRVHQNGDEPLNH